MPARPFRISIGGLMIVISLVGVALAFASLPVLIFVAIPLTILVGAIGLPARFGSMPKLRAAAWVCAAFPLAPVILFALTRVASCLIWGHPRLTNRAVLNQGENLVALLFGLTFSLFLEGVIIGLIGLLLIVLSESKIGFAPGGSDRRFLRMGGLLIGSTSAMIAVVVWISRRH